MRKFLVWRKPLTKIKVPNALQLNASLKFGMPQNLSAHCVLAHLLRIYTDGFGMRVYVDYT